MWGVCLPECCTPAHSILYVYCRYPSGGKLHWVSMRRPLDFAGRIISRTGTAFPSMLAAVTLRGISSDTYFANYLPKYQFYGSVDLPKHNSKKLAKVFFGYFRSASLASLWKVIFAIFLLFRPITLTQGCTNQTTPRRPTLDSL